MKREVDARQLPQLLEEIKELLIGATPQLRREQRDGLYELVRNHLVSVSDLFDALEREKDFGKAERLGLEFIEDIRLMQDLGWGEDEGREGIELTMQPHDLMEALSW